MAELERSEHQHSTWINDKGNDRTDQRLIQFLPTQRASHRCTEFRHASSADLVWEFRDRTEYIYSSMSKAGCEKISAGTCIISWRRH
jgi:hypothetical protein